MDEFEELAFSFEEPDDLFRDLFLGFPRESATERAARKDAARDVLQELEEAARYDAITYESALYARQLTAVTPIWEYRIRKARTPETREAA